MNSIDEGKRGWLEEEKDGLNRRRLAGRERECLEKEDG